MSNTTVTDFGRRKLDFNTPKVVEVLPDYFKSDYPKLIALLETYAQFMDSDGGVSDDIRQVLKSRDVNVVSLNFLDYILEEVGLGISGNQFVDPRKVTRNFPDFFKYKGSLFSAQAFFRALYGEEVEISYPKDQLFIVGESQIGPESLRFIQNGALYQTLSILIKSSKPISEWRDLYKQYVHPAGYYLGGEVFAEGIVDLSLNIMPDAVLDSAANVSTIVGDAVFTMNSADDPLTLLITSPDSDTEYRINTNKTILDIGDIQISNIDVQYSNVFEHDRADFKTFTDSSSVDWSNNIETFDQSIF